MLKLGILGHPLSHTRSPEMQMAGLKHLGIEASYEKFEISQDCFDTELASILKGLSGLNVTIPYKEKILHYLNMKDRLVEAIGAANTLTINDAGIKGYNTDYQGFIDSLAGRELKGSKVAILGAGGAAKAVMLALETLGVLEIKVFVRNFQKYEGQLPVLSKSDVSLLLFDESCSLSDFDLVINCTPLGQGRLNDEMPISREQVRSLKDTSLVYDLIYSDTRLLRAARERGLATIDGSKMLILQGVHSLKIWTACTIDEALIRVMSDAFYGVLH